MVPESYAGYYGLCAKQSVKKWIENGCGSMYVQPWHGLSIRLSLRCVLRARPVGTTTLYTLMPSARALSNALAPAISVRRY